jgi:hypothetical protein
VIKTISFLPFAKAKEFYFWKNGTHAMEFTVRSNKTPTWCSTVQVLFLQSHSTCFGHQAPIIRSVKKLARRPLVQVLYLQVGHHITITIPNMVMWWTTCNYNTCTKGRRASFLILLMMGAWRPKHVEWLQK